MKMTLGFFGACALACWTFPYAAFSDDRVGALEVGKLADLAVLSQDIFQADPLVIGKTRVTMTMVGGKIVFRAQP